MSTQAFNADLAMLKGADFFPRFSDSGKGVPLSTAGLKESVELLIAERNGERRGFLVRELAHPHMAQGELGGEPYLVSF